MRTIVRNGAHCKKDPEKTQVQKRYVIVAYHASDKNLGLICERQIVAENKINHNLVARHTCNVEGTLMQKERHETDIFYFLYFYFFNVATSHGRSVFYLTITIMFHIC